MINKNIVPLWSPTVGNFQLHIYNDQNEKLANKLEKKYPVVINYRHVKNTTNSRLSIDNQYALIRIVKILNRLHYKWHIDYFELGEVLEKYSLDCFNEHLFTTLEELEKFCNNYYNEADNKRRDLWWDVQTGKIAKPIEHDNTIIDNACIYCVHAKVVKVNHEIRNGIESYTPIYGCEYKNDNCQPESWPTEEK